MLIFMYIYCTITVHMSIFATKEEESVYKALLQEQGASVVTLAKKTRLHRPKLYQLLDALIREELVETYTKGKRVLYRAGNRDVLEKKIKDAKNSIEQDASILLSLADDLQTVKNINSKDDIVALFDDITTSLGEQGDYYSFTTKTSNTNLGKNSLEIFRKNREGKGLWSHVLTDKPIDHKKGVRFNLEIKHIDAKNLQQDCLWITYGDTFAFVDYTAETGYIVKNKKLAKFQQELFRFFYNKV